MADRTAAELAIAASRIKIFFATWLPSSDVGATQAKSTKNRFIRVGFEDQVPRRLSLMVEFFNADVFFTSGPLQKQFLQAYESKDFNALELLLMISLFCQGPAYWQFGSLKPKQEAKNLPTEARIFSQDDNLLYWSGLENSVWVDIANYASKLEFLTAEALNNVILDEIGEFTN
jgi:hypothetical protein